MAIELPDHFDKTDIEHFVDERVTETEKLLQDQIDALQQYVDALESELKRVADVVADLEDKQV